MAGARQVGAGYVVIDLITHRRDVRVRCSMKPKFPQNRIADTDRGRAGGGCIRRQRRGAALGASRSQSRLRSTARTRKIR
ncbi:hypothetical protein C8Q80DRAFT_1201804 [Daedaleopsis nitida]|nr:hypothetical protein C8Q80DRAFT_1201804 [Daedaleopsis nitida]